LGRPELPFTSRAFGSAEAVEPQRVATPLPREPAHTRIQLGQEADAGKILDGKAICIQSPGGLHSDVIGRQDRAGTTWSPGQELTLTSGKKAEADFLLWYQRKHMFATDEPTQVVFGEAKSFGKDAFQDEDVERMKLLAEEYSGAVLVLPRSRRPKTCRRTKSNASESSPSGAANTIEKNGKLVPL
jgi:hypothetical protein